MGHARITLDPASAVGDVSPRLFGSFVEHMGRCVYTGIFEPGHPTADEDGLRGDTLDLVRELGASIARYPGGNFVSGYRWEDGVGPVDERPRRLDLAWRQVETNRFGLHEFMTWAGRAGIEPMMVTNLGTRGMEQAVDLLEYCNHPGGTALSDLRAEHGSSDPFDVRVWCLGNEMDGPWQIGAKSADEYGRLAAETAKAMRQVDPTIELVATGSSNRRMPTYATWEATVLEHCADEVDYISLHAYHEQLGDDRGSFLAAAADMDGFIEDVVATCDHASARRRSSKRINLSFDEWNVWYEAAFTAQEREPWQEAPRLIEDTYGVTDAVVVGSMLSSLLRHADRVKIACQAQLVNVIAPIRTEPGGPAWRQTVFHPFALTARWARGRSLHLAPSSPVYETGRFGTVPVLDAAATHDAEREQAAVFLTNRDQVDELVVEVDLRALPGYAVVEALSVHDDDAAAANTEHDPQRVVPRALATRVQDQVVTIGLPPTSWTVLRLAQQR